jgi:NitT/TauT family transport system substrate-binding protein
MKSDLAQWGRGLAQAMAALLAGAATLLAAASCAGVGGRAAEKLTVASPPLEQAALIYVAADQGYFARNGLAVAVQGYDSGLTALDALLKGDADIAEAAEYPVAGLAFRKEPVEVIATNDEFENEYLVARRDRGIAAPAGLKGKRVGVARGTIAEFYLGRLLELQGMGLQNVSLVDVQPEDFVSAFAGGSIDAIVAWQPYVAQMQKAAPAPVVWPAQSGQAAFGVLVTRARWLDGHVDTAQRFLASLKEAQDYITAHPEEARSIVAKQLGDDPAYVAGIWPQHRFALSLDRPLIMALEDEAAWMIRSGLATGQELPDFSAYIDARALQAAAPGAVSIVR